MPQTFWRRTSHAEEDPPKMPVSGGVLRPQEVIKGGLDVNDSGDVLDPPREDRAGGDSDVGDNGEFLGDGVDDAGGNGCYDGLYNGGRNKGVDNDVDWLDVCDSVVDITISESNKTEASCVYSTDEECCDSQLAGVREMMMTSARSDAHIIDEMAVAALKKSREAENRAAGEAQTDEKAHETDTDPTKALTPHASCRSHSEDEQRLSETPKKNWKMDSKTTPMETREQKSDKPNHGFGSTSRQFALKIAQKQTPAGGRNPPKHYGNNRKPSTTESLWMSARMLILSSIWVLRMLSDKVLVMAVLVNVLSSALTSTTVVAAESTKGKEKVVAPVFLEPVPNVTVAVGREASLTCTVDHLGIHKVAWIHLDRQMILSIHNHVITRTPRFGVTHDSHKTWTLHVSQVKEEDRGHYMCQVNTKPMISQTGFLQVVVPPNIMDEMSSPSSIVVREKDEVTLSCHGEGFPLPQIKWRREDGKPIETPDGRRIGQLEGPNLPLQQVSRIDMGAYLCIASNGVPPSVSKRITLDVEFAPQMHVPNQLVGAPMGTEVHLECFVEAHPRAITYWEFSDAMVMNTTRVTTDSFEDLYKINMVLTIRDLSDSDFGTYKCISKNSIAETDGSITLNKTYRPTAPPQTMLHSSDDDGRSHQSRGRSGKEQQRKQLEASRRRYQEEEAERRGDEDTRKQTHDLDIQKYDREPNLGYRDENSNRITNPPIDSGASRLHLTVSAICWLTLHALPQL